MEEDVNGLFFRCICSASERLTLSIKGVTNQARYNEKLCDFTLKVCHFACGMCYTVKGTK